MAKLVSLRERERKRGENPSGCSETGISRLSIDPGFRFFLASEKSVFPNPNPNLDLIVDYSRGSEEGRSHVKLFLCKNFVMYSWIWENAY